MGKSEWDDDLLNDGEGDSSLVKDLRRQLRAAKKDIEERDDKITSLSKVSRERSVESVLTSKGVRKGIAKFIPSDITDEADIEKWLEDNADDLGITLSNDSGGDAGSEPDSSTVDRSRADALAGRGVAPSKAADLEARLNKAQSPQEIEQIMAEARQLIM
jgi:hypothetical protein